MAKMVNGLPLFGSSFDFLSDTTKLLVSNYKKHGPIFRIRVLWLKFTVILGFEAKQFMIEDGERHLTRHPIFDPVGEQLGRADFSLALSGAKHMELRHLLQLGYSREVASAHVPDFIRVVREAASEWKPESIHEVFETVQHLAFLQYCKVMGNVDWRAHYKDIRNVTDMNMEVGGRVLPLWMFKWPSYRAARERVLKLIWDLVKAHKSETPKPNRPADIIDTLSSLKFPDGRAMTDDEVVCYSLYGFAGSSSYMGRLIAFMLYEILRDPQLHQRVKDEVDNAFMHGLRNAADVASMSLLRAVYNETLRFHPVSQGMPYVAAEDFEFNGYRVEKGQLVVLSALPMLFAEDPFRNADRFEPERCMEPRNEHRKMGAFNPFGMQHRTCAAMGLVELMSMTMVAALLREVEIEMMPSDYKLKKVARPLPAPSRAFRIRTRHRQTVTEQYRKKIQASEEVCLATFPGADNPEVAKALHEGKYQDFEAREVIIKQGDPADAFYLLTAGHVEVIRSDARGHEEDPIPLGPGSYFGEIGLLHNIPRTATVRVTRDGPATTLVLSGEAFRKIIAASDMISSEIARVMRKRSAINQLHQLIQEASILQLASKLPGFTPIRVAAGQTVVRQGDPPDTFYIIFRGHAEVSHPTKEGLEHVATLHPGDYFGEAGLMHNVPRNASIMAGYSELLLLKCDRETFNKLIADTPDLALALTQKLQRT